MSDFEREMLTNAHVQAAVETGSHAAFALLKRGGEWEVDDESDETAHQMAQQISAAVVEAARSSMLREAAHLVAKHAAGMHEVKHYSSYTSDHITGVRLAQELLATKADELDRSRTREFGLAVDLQRIADVLRGDQS